ncbi:MAG TPA: type I polyketide synthase [Polynucleobacter sp.]|jgi:myxalamid-type polyketide synthase MxaB|nr:type I polyketide synthase [Polynucleobacter sp.]HQT20567.1 type I polyketide synthase [Polynucleobacter sp.]HQT40792.1 type I polyketide synthase [Polynucleobacter sp.]
MAEGNPNPQNSRDLIKGALIKIDELESELESLKAEKNEPIAIIGMGCRFPGGANNPDALWDLLAKGTDAITEVPSTRWDIHQLYDADLNAPGKMNTRFGGFVNNVTDFDPEFFGISPREAASMDPQQRLLLEVCWEALENADINPQILYGVSAGVFIGIIAYDYGQRILGINRINEIDAYAGTGSSLGVAAGRLSYTLGLTGPSLSVDTACSSSLVTVHLACESLKRKECNLAIAGGVNLMLEPGLSVNFSKAHMLAPDGKCKTFDSSADGYVRGEGCGVVVLKRLSDALAANDPILALIKGSAVNQDGASGGLTIPSGPSQASVIRQALKNAGCEPSAVDYIEAHGTGTSLGDPIELGSLDQVFSHGRKSDHPLLVGSIKTNVGHLEAAAGIAGIMKLVLSLKHEQIPPHLNCTNPTNRFPWSEKPIQIAQHLSKWERSDKARIAGISSFGFSGTNAHILIEEAPTKSTLETKRGDDSNNAPQLLNLSAQTPEALFELAKSYKTKLQGQDAKDIYQLCASASQSRSKLKYRLSILANTKIELERNISDYLDHSPSPEIAVSLSSEKTNHEIAFLFTGQGSQYPGMGKELYASQAEFKKWIDHCESILKKYGDTDLTTLLFKSDSEILNQSLYTQPSLFCLEYSLAKFWQALGVQPSLLIGHSLGEYVAACLAGVFSLEDAIAIIHKRASLMQALPRNGAMAAVSASAEILTPYLKEFSETISIAAINSDSICVLSGNETNLNRLLEKLKAEKIGSKMLQVSHAFHSQLMEPMMAEFERSLTPISFGRAQIPIISNLTGMLADDSISTPAYWLRHVREAVQFSKSIDTLKDSGIDICIEVGPNPVLSAMASEKLSQQILIPSLKQNQASDWQFLQSLGKLNALGLEINWESIYPRASLTHVSLPNYPFQRERYWIERSFGSTPKKVSQNTHPLVGALLTLPGTSTNQLRYENYLDCNKPYLQEHRVFSQAILPATAFIEMAIAAFLETDSSLPIGISEFEIDQALFISQSNEMHTQIVLELEQHETEFCIYSNNPISVNAQGKWVLNSHGKIKRLDKSSTPQPINIKHLKDSFKESVSISEFYESCNLRRIEYGESYQLIRELWHNEKQAFAKIDLANNADTHSQRYYAYPTIFDACLQTLWAVLPQGGKDEIWLPIGLEHLKLYQSFGNNIFCHVQLKTAPTEQMQLADIQVLSSDGKILCAIENIKAKKATPLQLQSLSMPAKEADSLLYDIEWQSSPLRNRDISDSQLMQKGSWLAFADETNLASELQAKCKNAGIECILVSKGSSFIEKDAQHFEINPQDPQSFEMLFERLGALKIINCIYLWGLDITQSPNDQQPLSDQLRLAWEAPLYLTQALEKTASQNECSLTFITRNAFSINRFSKPNIGHSPLLGLGKSIAAEIQNLNCTVIDLDAVTSINNPAAEAAILFSELNQVRTVDTENQVAYRDAQRYVSRLKHANHLTLPASPSYRLAIPSSGSLADLSWQSCERKAPAANEVEIEVHTTGLNFKDILLALHRVNAVGDGLGVECAGTIARVGPGVTQFSVGDRVLAMVPGSLSRFVCAPVATTAALPPDLEDGAAATIPITFLTSAYALESLAKIGPGDRVLIHAGTGGVGQAAIQIAQRAGAQVFATASQGKWQILEDLGVKHIFDSRTTEFESAINQLTDGKGVDIVLNSLAGEFTDASLRLLKPGGRFLEIGITDLRTPDQVEQISPGIKYFPIDLMDLYRDERTLLQTLLQGLLERFAKGELKPLPYQLYPASTVETAFRTMQQAKHTGKVVIDLNQNPVKIEGEASYLILGGLGDLGLALTQWLIDQNAQHIVLVGRTPPSSEKQSYIDTLCNKGADIQYLQANISDAEELKNVFEILSNSKHPLKGIFQCAGVVDDGMLSQQNSHRFKKVLSSKMDSTWLVHHYSKNLPIDFLALFSSATSMLGAPGQANYVVANTFLDELAHYRHAQGLRTFSINWGAWNQIGLAARMNLHDHLAKQGIKPIDPALAFRALGEILQSDSIQVGAMDIDWGTYLSKNNRPSFFSNLAEKLGNDQSSSQSIYSSLLQELQATPKEDQSPLMQAYVAQNVAAVLGIPKSRKMDRMQGFFDMGMDSLTSVELKNRLSADLKISFPATLAFDHPNISSLADHLLSKLMDSRPSISIDKTIDNDAELKAIAALSEEDAEETLKQALREMGFDSK